MADRLASIETRGCRRFLARRFLVYEAGPHRSHQGLGDGSFRGYGQTETPMSSTQPGTALAQASVGSVATTSIAPDVPFEAQAHAQIPNVGAGFLVAGQFKTTAGRYLRTWRVDAAGTVAAAPAPLTMGTDGPDGVRLAGFGNAALAVWSDNPSVSARLLPSVISQ